MQDLRPLEAWVVFQEARDPFQSPAIQFHGSLSCSPQEHCRVLDGGDVQGQISEHTTTTQELPGLMWIEGQGVLNLLLGVPHARRSHVLCRISGPLGAELLD